MGRNNSIGLNYGPLTANQKANEANIEPFGGIESLSIVQNTNKAPILTEMELYVGNIPYNVAEGEIIPVLELLDACRKYALFVTTKDLVVTDLLDTLIWQQG